MDYGFSDIQGILIIPKPTFRTIFQWELNKNNPVGFIHPLVYLASVIGDITACSTMNRRYGRTPFEIGLQVTSSFRWSTCCPVKTDGLQRLPVRAEEYGKVYRFTTELSNSMKD